MFIFSSFTVLTVLFLIFKPCGLGPDLGGGPNFFQFGKKVTGNSYKRDTKVKTDSAKKALDIAKKEFKQSKTFQNQKDNIPSSFETPSGKPMNPRVSAKIVSENAKGGLITGKPKLAKKGWK